MKKSKYTDKKVAFVVKQAETGTSAAVFARNVHFRFLMKSTSCE